MASLGGRLAEKASLSSELRVDAPTSPSLLASYELRVASSTSVSTRLATLLCRRNAWDGGGSERALVHVPRHEVRVTTMCASAGSSPHRNHRRCFGLETSFLGVVTRR